jgi:hypothetical protein
VLLYEVKFTQQISSFSICAMSASARSVGIQAAAAAQGVEVFLFYKKRFFTSFLGDLFRSVQRNVSSKCSVVY